MKLIGNINFKLFYFMYLLILSSCMSMYLCVWTLRYHERVSNPLEKELQTIIDSYMCWELNLGPLEKQLLLLAPEPSP